MVIGPDGEVKIPETSLGPEVRLGWRDDLAAVPGGALNIAGDGDAEALVLTWIGAAN